MREWLRRLNDSGFDLLANEQQLLNQTLSVKLLAQKLSQLIFRPASDDLSHEVHEVMNGCLACKACASQCPVRVDVPDFRALDRNHRTFPYVWELECDAKTLRIDFPRIPSSNQFK